MERSAVPVRRLRTTAIVLLIAWTGVAGLALALFYGLALLYVRGVV